MGACRKVDFKRTYTPDSLLSMCVDVISTHCQRLESLAYPMDEALAQIILHRIMSKGRLTTPIAMLFIKQGLCEDVLKSVDLLAGIPPPASSTSCCSRPI